MLRFLAGALIVMIVLFLIGRFDGRGAADLAVPAVVASAESIAPSVQGAAWGVFEVTTGELLYAEAESSTHAIGSITQLMTGAVIEAEFANQHTATVTPEVLAELGQDTQYQAGDILPVPVLLYPLLLESSGETMRLLQSITDASLVSHLQFLASNQAWRATTFADTTGASPATVSSVADLADLAGFLYRRQQRVFAISKTESFTYEAYEWKNQNELVGVPGYQGGKVHRTDDMNQAALVLFDEVIADEVVTIGYVVLGSTNVLEDISALRASAVPALTVSEFD